MTEHTYEPPSPPVKIPNPSAHWQHNQRAQPDPDYDPAACSLDQDELDALRATMPDRPAETTHAPYDPPPEHRAHDVAAMITGVELASDLFRLGPGKLSVEQPPSSVADSDFRFRNCSEERQFWLRTLPTIETDAKILARFINCGVGAWIYHDPNRNQYHVRAKTCKLRICPACRRPRQKKASDRVAKSFPSIGRGTHQFITLTLRHSDRPLSEQLAHIKSSFRKLRQRKLWKQSVGAGIAVLEIGYNAHEHQWHPHLHIIAECTYIDWSLLRKAWLACTLTSDNIDCRVCDSTNAAAVYMAKYLGKPPDDAMLQDHDKASEYYLALKSTNLLIPFGGVATLASLEPETKEDDPYVPVASFQNIQRRAREGETWALYVIQQVTERRDKDDHFRDSQSKPSDPRPEMQRAPP